MKCWVIVYHHRFGTDAWPLFQARRPTKRRVLRDMPDWEGEGSPRNREDEWYEILGPWEVPGK